MHPEIAAAKELDSLQVPRSDEIPHLERAIEMGIPFVEIVRHARKKNIDLIVIGTHGRTGLDHMLLGSVAEKVVRKAPCPVLTVRPEGHQFVMP
jgi:nucleotide-binding universal stress UspA family protein